MHKAAKWGTSIVIGGVAGIAMSSTPSESIRSWALPGALTISGAVVLKQKRGEAERNKATVIRNGINELLPKDLLENRALVLQNLAIKELELKQKEQECRQKLNLFRNNTLSQAENRVLAEQLVSFQSDCNRLNLDIGTLTSQINFINQKLDNVANGIWISSPYIREHLANGNLMSAREALREHKDTERILESGEI